MNFVDELPEKYRLLGRNYGMSVLNKTRFSSHVNFLRRCLKRNVIPKGFQVQRNVPANLPTFLFRRITKATTSCSKKKLITSIQHFSHSLDKADSLLLSCKDELANIQDPFVSRLKFEVFELNKILYNCLKEVKDRKFDTVDGRVVASIIEDDGRVVVTIPEDLELSEDEKKVLSKGLTFVPTIDFLDKSSTLHDLDKFYRRVKLHAFFNDPNRGFIDITEDDEYKRYRKTNSSWIPPISVHGIDNFISRCKEEVFFSSILSTFVLITSWIYFVMLS